MKIHNLRPYCLIPPVTLQTSPRGILEPWTHSQYCPSLRDELQDRTPTVPNLFTGPGFEEPE